MPYISFDSFFWDPVTYGAHARGPQCWKMQFLGNLKWPTKEKVQKTKKFRKQKSSVSLSQNWSASKFLVSGQTLVSYGQKNIFREFCPLKWTVSKDGLSMTIFSSMGDFFGDFGIQPSEVCIGEVMYQISSGLVAFS